MVTAKGDPWQQPLAAQLRNVWKILCAPPSIPTPCAPEELRLARHEAEERLAVAGLERQVRLAEYRRAWDVRLAEQRRAGEPRASVLRLARPWSVG